MDESQDRQAAASRDLNQEAWLLHQRVSNGVKILDALNSAAQLQQDRVEFKRQHGFDEWLLAPLLKQLAEAEVRRIDSLDSYVRQLGENAQEALHVMELGYTRHANMVKLGDTPINKSVDYYYQWLVNIAEYSEMYDEETARDRRDTAE